MGLGEPKNLGFLKEAIVEHKLRSTDAYENENK